MSNEATQDEGLPLSKGARLLSALRKVALPLGVAVGALVLGLTVGGLVERRWLADRVMPHVVVLGQDYGGLQPAEVHAALVVAKAQLLNRRCTMVVRGREFAVTPAQAGFDFDVAAAEKKVGERGRVGSWWSKWSWRLQRLWSPSMVDVAAHFDPPRLSALLDEWQQKAIDDPPLPARIEYKAYSATGARPRAGTAIDAEGTAETWTKALTAGGHGPLKLELPIYHYEPFVSLPALAAAQNRAQQLIEKPITLLYEGLKWPFPAERLGAALRSRPILHGELEVSLDAAEIDRLLIEARVELERTAVEAHFVIDKQEHVTVAPSMPAKRIVTSDVIAALWTASQTPERSIAFPVREVEEAKLNTSQATALGITQRVASFVTHHACCQPRVKNIHRMADLLNDTVLAAGEILSVNGRVGERTQARGFVAGPTIVEGEIEDTFGGGVSQFATTLFNAVLEGGYQLLERQAHSYYFQRYPLGHDATLSFPKPDLIFKNDTHYGLLIKATYTDTSIRIALYGNNEGRRVERKVSGAFDFKDPPIDYVPDEELKPDEEKVKERGSRGFSVLATRIITQPDGTRSEEARKVVYKPRERVLAVHPCKIPKEDEDHSDEECPEPEEEETSAQDGAAGAPAQPVLEY